ncbi:alpha-amylase family protein [Bdellovibrio sp. NC01]|uniref:alpha-amylase n=1 Tax=Bdellovibrio sp. NC01 TaxID=2220073 RepID=UPI001FEE6CD5|nr:alpha-amylase family protein [Bdellovibrio sp. NC01]
MKKLSLCLSIFCLFFASFAAQAAPRTVFVQMFEWPWKDIARECELYLGPAGFSAVQVSPPHEHIVWEKHPWWERYQVASYKIESRSGNEAEFADMVKRCRRAGVDIYADAVINHMTGIPGGTAVGGTSFTHYDYPGIYDFNDFHHCGRNGNDDIVNYKDLYELQNCELVDLADLATETSKVQNTIAAYLNHLLDLGVAGFRIDAAKHIPAKDLKAIMSQLKRSAYVYQEVIYDPAGPISYADYTPIGDVTAYDYAHRLGAAIKDKKMDGLLHIGENFPASNDSIVFVTNHDLERTGDPYILKYSSEDQKLYRLAQIFMLAWPFGYPQVYTGYDFTNYDDGPPLNEQLRTLPVLSSQNQCTAPFTCEHRLPEVAAMVDFRNQTDGSFVVNNFWSNNTDQLAFSRGQKGFVAINFSGNQLPKEFQTGLPAGKYCNIVGASYNPNTHSCPNMIEVNAQGKANVVIQAYSAMVLLNRTTASQKKKAL